ncbi:MAG: hypothetical protein GF313_06485 [Caldithrix sp.]|nr:hypothetical protein [Caldithrix sp.]
MHTQTGLKILLIGLLFWACNVFEPQPEEQEAIEGSLFFTVICDSTGMIKDHTGYLLHMQTEKIYNCFNYQIESFNFITTNTIHMDIQGIHRPNTCATAFGPAKLNYSLPVGEGDYELDISYKDKRDRYELIFEPDSIRVRSLHSQFTQYNPAILNR